MAGKGRGGEDVEYMESRSTSANLTIAYCVFMIIFGLGALGVGIWMNADWDVKSYLFVFGSRNGQNWLIVATGMCIACGILLVAGAAVGCNGATNSRPILLQVFIIVMLIVFVCFFVIGFMLLGFREQIFQYVQTSMKYQIEHEYQWDNYVGKQWNRVQVRNRCCGVDGSWDYRCSDWWYSQNPGVECPKYYYMGNVHVPDSCCALEFNQDRNIKWVDPQNPRPKNSVYCQEHAEGNQDGSDYLNGRGCFSAMLDFIYIHIYLLMGIGIFLGCIQILGIIVAWSAYRGLRKEL